MQIDVIFQRLRPQIDLSVHKHHKNEVQTAHASTDWTSLQFHANCRDNEARTDLNMNGEDLISRNAISLSVTIQQFLLTIRLSKMQTYLGTAVYTSWNINIYRLCISLPSLDLQCPLVQLHKPTTELQHGQVCSQRLITMIDYLCISVVTSLPACLSICLCVYLPFCLPACLFIHIPVQLLFTLHVYVSVWQTQNSTRRPFIFHSSWVWTFGFSVERMKLISSTDGEDVSV